MKADIVCEGGGVKGIALLGAIYYLEEKGYTFEHFPLAFALSTADMEATYFCDEMK